MSQSYIDKFVDGYGNVFYPETKEKAITDDNGVRLSSKLESLSGTIDCTCVYDEETNTYILTPFGEVVHLKNIFTVRFITPNSYVSEAVFELLGKRYSLKSTSGEPVPVGVFAGDVVLTLNFSWTENNVGLVWSELIPNAADDYFTNASVIDDVVLAVDGYWRTIRSDDSGLTWGDPVEVFGNSSYSTNAISGVGDIAVAVGTKGAIARSTDKGITWSGMIASPLEDEYISSVICINGVFIAGAAGGMISRSTDLGLTWSELIPNPLEESSIVGIFDAGGVAIVSTNAAIMARSTNMGLTWELIEDHPFDRVRAVAYSDGVTIAVGDGGRIARSFDKGKTWGDLIVPSFVGSASLQTVENFDGIFLLGGDLDILARSEDYGVTWNLVQNPFDEAQFYQSVYSIANVNGTAIAFGKGGKISRSLP